MNTTVASVEELTKGIAAATSELDSNSHVDVLVCPPFVNISKVIDLAGDSGLKVGAQNMSAQEKGAFTGETSSDMLESVGCSHVILGHSERRQYYGETDQIVGEKLQRAIASNLTPILCIGESLEQREAGSALDVNRKQLEGALSNIEISNATDLVVAYEPVWAIGTGVTASPEQAQEVHAFIRSWLADRFTQEIADGIIILYGGSMKPANAEELLSLPDVDGGLIGGASLDAASLATVIEIANVIPSTR